MKHIFYKITLDRVAADNIVFKGKGDRIFYSQRIALDARKIQQLTIYEHDTEGKLARVTFAKAAEWTATHWQLTDGYIRHFEGGIEVGYEAFDRHTRLNDTRIPPVLSGSEKDPRAMTIEELRQQITYKQEAGQIFAQRAGKVVSQNSVPVRGCRCCYAWRAYCLSVLGEQVSSRGS